MKIPFKGLLYAAVPAILVYMLIDAMVEYVILKTTGVSFLPFLQEFLHRQYGTGFYVINSVLFCFEMLLVMFFYAMIRPQFDSKIKPVAVSVVFFICFTGLFLVQLVNLGVYPIPAALIFGISTAVGFPPAVFIGAVMYEK